MEIIIKVIAFDSANESISYLSRDRDSWYLLQFLLKITIIYDNKVAI